MPIRMVSIFLFLYFNQGSFCILFLRIFLFSCIIYFMVINQLKMKEIYCNQVLDNIIFFKVLFRYDSKRVWARFLKYILGLIIIIRCFLEYNLSMRETRKKSQCSCHGEECQQEQNRQIAKGQKSQFLEEYTKSIPKLQEKQIQQAQQLLKAANFIKHQEYQPYLQEILKADAYSILYKITYGFYSTNISVYTHEYSLAIERSKVNEGAFGRIYAVGFEGSSSHIIAKTITICKNSLSIPSRILKEIFFVKFTSAIKIGPQFLSHYGFDLIIVNSRYQFLMENCQFVASQVNIKTFQTQILKRLALLHHFQGLHCDMKPENLGWSKNQEKFILLDFGLSKFAAEEVGYRTLTSFRGSVMYASKQMKNIFCLKTKAPIDLYYNDLHCLKKTVVAIKENYSNPFLRCESQKFEVSKDWSKIIPLYRLFYQIFVMNMAEIKRLVFEESELLLTFRKTIHRISHFQLYSECFEELKRKIIEKYRTTNYEAALDEKKFDSFLLLQTNIKQQLKIKMLQPSPKNLEVIHHRKLLDQIWLMPQWTQFLFTKLFDVSHTQQSLATKKQMLTELSKIQNCPQTKSEQEKLLIILNIFEDYFLKKTDLHHLFKLKCIYQILLFLTDLQSLQTKIINLVISGKDDGLYFQFLKYSIFEFLSPCPELSNALLVEVLIPEQITQFGRICLELFNECRIISANFVLMKDISFEKATVLMKSLTVVPKKQQFFLLQVQVLFHKFIGLITEKIKYANYLEIIQSRRLSKEAYQQRLYKIAYPFSTATFLLRVLNQRKKNSQELNASELILKLHNYPIILLNMPTLWQLNLFKCQNEIQKVVDFCEEFMLKSQGNYFFFQYFACIFENFFWNRCVKYQKMFYWDKKGEEPQPIKEFEKISRILSIFFKFTSILNFDDFHEQQECLDKLGYLSILIIDKVYSLFMAFPHFNRASTLGKTFSALISLVKRLKIDSLKICQLYLTFLSAGLNLTTGEHLIQNEQKLIEQTLLISEYSRQHHVSYTILSSIYNLLYLYLPHLSHKTVQSIRKIVIERYKSIRSIDDTLVMQKCKFIVSEIVKNLFEESNQRKVLPFLVEYSIKSNAKNFKFQMDGEFFKKKLSALPIPLVLAYLQQKVKQLKPIDFYQNIFLNTLIYMSFELCESQLDKQSRNKIIALLSFDLNGSFSANAFLRNMIKSTILKWQKKRKGIKLRKKKIAFFQEGKCSARKEVMQAYIAFLNSRYIKKMSPEARRYMIKKVNRLCD